MKHPNISFFFVFIFYFLKAKFGKEKKKIPRSFSFKMDGHFILVFQKKSPLE